jgi:hypothetical protein
MLTLPSTLEKGSPLSFSLNKSAVLAAAQDAYWQTAANIKRVIVIYRSSGGNQRKRLEFDFTQADPVAIATWTSSARAGHDIEQVILEDFDGDTYSIPSASLPSGKGVDFGGGVTPPIVVPIVHNYSPNGLVYDMTVNGSDLYMAGAFTSLRYQAPNAAFISPTTGENQLKDMVSGKFPVFNGQIKAMVKDGDDTLFVGGAFSTMDGVARNYLAKLIRQNGNWVSDTSWNQSGKREVTSTVECLSIIGSNLIVGGSFQYYKTPAGTNQSSPHFVAVNKSTGDFSYAISGISFSSTRYGRAVVYEGSSGWVCGTFGLRKFNVATGAAITQTFPSFGTSYEIYDICLGSDGIFVGGWISSGTNYCITKLSKDTGEKITSFVTPFTNSTASGPYVYSLALSGNELLVGGTFSTPGKNILKLNATTGAVISEFNAGNACYFAGATATVRKIAVSGSSVYAMGNFDGRGVSGDPVTCLNIVKLDLTTGAKDGTFASANSLQSPASESIWNMVVDGSDLIVGGLFSGFGGYSRQGVAKLSKDSDGNWKVVEAFDTSNGGTIVNSVAVSGDALYIGGGFTSWGGQTRNRVAKLNATTGALDPSFAVGAFTSGLTTGQFNGVTGGVTKMLIDGQDVVIAGAFTGYSRKSSATTAINVTIPSWIRVNAATNTESVPTVGAGNILDAILDGSEIIFAGTFTNWGGQKYVVRANKMTGAVAQGWSAPLNYTIPGATQVIRVSGNYLYCASFSAGVDGVTGAAGIFVLNKTTGAVAKTYQSSQIGFSHSVQSGEIVEDSDYVYFLVGRLTSGSGSLVRRFSKADLSFDSSWGFGSLTSVGEQTIRAAALLGKEILVSGDGGTVATLSPLGKRLYSLKTSDASQNSNI